MSQDFKRSSKRRNNSPTYPFLQLIQHIQFATGSTNPDMTTVFYVRLCGRFQEPQKEETSFIYFIIYLGSIIVLMVLPPKLKK